MKNKCPFLKDNKECTYKRIENKKYKKLPVCIYNNETKCILWSKSLSEAENFSLMAVRRLRMLCEDKDDN